MLSRVRAWLRRDDDIAEEIERHLEELREERLAMGDSDAQADRFARLKLGNRTGIEEAVRGAKPLPWIEMTVIQLRLATRTLLRHRQAYLAAVGILAVGIGDEHRHVLVGGCGATPAAPVSEPGVDSTDLEGESSRRELC
jgi:hypothetical protein